MAAVVLIGATEDDDDEEARVARADPDGADADPLATPAESLRR